MVSGITVGEKDATGIEEQNNVNEQKDYAGERR
jgi:hypothetical protein